MCGVAGAVNCVLTPKDLCSISHRGPDNQELIELDVESNKIFFGHTRLAILDLSPAGNQPMFSECKNYCIVFNGEIYNHLELRRKLNGIEFSGHSDTETILYYLREFGIESVKDFIGIFAFAFLDKRKHQLFLVRDHFGVKPLYYYKKNNQLLFASELKIILNNEAFAKELDLTALNSFLTFRYNPAPQTLIKGIKKLEPAHYLKYCLKDGETEIVPYWVSSPVIKRISDADAIEQYKFLLVKAVKRQLLSDVPVGLLLSGGIDSAVLGHLMSEISDKPIKTFTIGFHGNGDYNELADARETSSLIKSEHYEVLVEKREYLDFFYKSFYHTEEPIAEPTIPALFYVSQLASKHVKVVLSGQGADEPMAGYKRYVGEQILSKYKWFLPFMPVNMVSRLLPANGTLARGLYASRFNENLDRFIGIYTLFTPELKRRLYKDDYFSAYQQDQRFLFEKNFARTEFLTDSLSKLLYLDTRTMLPDNLLLFNDKLTMANSLENRVPYLDLDLVNFLETLPIDLKIRGKVGKYLHRKAAQDWLPLSIINRKKRGFSTPIDEWLKSDLSKLLIDLVESQDSLSRQYLNIDFIKTMVSYHRNKKCDYERQLFIILSLELWYKHFFNQKLN
ncbi:asparagine synthase (glutamine-hydrolyzing) [Flavihumibacter sp. R14]|nr:asparagine synthase (glutamine-hydrolyzing) [Flavihumibacter soli]